MSSPNQSSDTRLIPSRGAQANTFIQITNPQGHAEIVRYDNFVRQLFKADGRPMMLMHAALGICGEAGELSDAIKKHVVYGKPVDLANVVEEIGDLMFYVHEMMNLFDVSEQDILQHNANKLSKRYAGLKYTDEAAINRADKQEE